MNSTTNRKIYRSMARNLLAVGQYRGLAQRYLDTLRHRKVINAGAKSALDLSRKDNPLTLIEFTSPLSVAGPLADTFPIRALIERGIPLATELDARGRHRGTSIGDCIDQMRQFSGVRLSEMDVLLLYQKLMVGHPKMLDRHPIRRYRVIPKLKRQLAQEMDELEGRMAQAVVIRDGRIFACAVPAATLESAIMGKDGGVILGHAGTGAPLRVGGKVVATVWGMGRGLAVVSVADLRELIGLGGIVGIECDLGGWNGYVELDNTIERRGERRFNYWEG